MTMESNGFYNFVEIHISWKKRTKQVLDELNSQIISKVRVLDETPHVRKYIGYIYKNI